MVDSVTSGGTKEQHQFSFTGTGKEYFGIWIVNLLLSIVTLGIYTAWAKVRRLRYFYGNTWLDGHNFEYHAKPMQILIGRIIVVVVLVVLNVLANISPLISVLIVIPYLIGLPWLINKAFAFNARMTSYRNVHFSFQGSYLRALWVFAIVPLFVPLVFGALIGGYAYMNNFALQTNDLSAIYTVAGLSVLGVVAYLLFIPYISKLTNTYIAENTRFGTTVFQPDISLNPLFRNMGFTLLISLLPLLLAFGVLWALSIGSVGGMMGVLALSAGQAFVLFGYFALIAGFLVYAAGVRNIAFNATSLEGGHQLQSNVSRIRYAWIILSNLFLSIISIGLLIPWAAVRTWRYLMGQTGLETPGLDQFVSDQEAQGNVIAAEYLDIDGIDFGL